MKILVINIKYLGDLVVSTPAIRSLHQAYPSAEIVMLIRKGFETFFENNPNINRTILFDPGLKGNSGFNNFLKGIKFLISLRREKFDTVIVLHPGDRTAFWAWFSGAKIRIAPRNQNFSFLFNLKVDVEENSINYIDYYSRIISSYNVSIDSDRTEIFFSEDDTEWTDHFFAENHFESKDFIIGIHPGASEPSKIWKRENFILLIDRLIQNPGIKLVILEGPREKEICSALKSTFKESMKIGFTDAGINRTAALIKKCNLFITHDTGTRHLAVAAGTPALILMPDDNEKFWDFYTDSQKHFTLIGRRNYTELQPFLDGISVNDVYQKIGRILNQW